MTFKKIYIYDSTCELTYNDVISKPVGGSEFQLYNLIQQLSTNFSCLVFNHTKYTKTELNVTYHNLSKIYEDEFIDKNAHIIIFRFFDPNLRQKYSQNKMYIWLQDLDSDNLVANQNAIINDNNLLVVSNSRFCNDFCVPKNIGDLHPQRKLIIYNALYEDFYNRSEDTYDKFQILYASAWQKGIEKIVQLFLFIHSHDHRYKLVLTSPGYDWDKFEDYRIFLKTHHPKSITILEPQTKKCLSKIICNSVCVFAPSFGETFGCMFAEALYLGTPVIASLKSGAVKEIIGDEFVLDYDKPYDVLDKVENLTENRPIVKLDEKFLSPSIVNKWKKIFT